MAAPLKKKLDYFPLDVDFFEDEKIEAIAGEFGEKGELAVVKLLCAVYKNGYFIVWNDLTKGKLLKRLPRCSGELLEQIVNRLVKWEFFNKDLFNSDKVLTSVTIQECYKLATKRRLDPQMNKYVCINLDNVNINTHKKRDNVNINRQTKLNETKLNETNEAPPIFEEGEIITETPSMILRKLWAKALQDKAKAFGLGPEEIEIQLKNFDNHHVKNQTAFTDARHIFNSWGKWCENIFTKKQEVLNGSGKKENTIAIPKPKFTGPKRAEDYF